MTDEDQLRQRAAQRWRWRLLLPGLVGGLIGPLFGNVLFHGRHHHDSPLASVAGVVVGVGLVVGVFVLITRRNPRLLAGDGFFSAPLSAGLGWRQRRVAARSIRRGRPSSEATMRLVEQDLARRGVRQARRSLAVFLLFLPLSLACGIFADVTTAGRVYFFVGAALLAACAVRSVIFTRQARAYLELTDGEGLPSGSTTA